jgi:hypothetical protein
LTGDSESYVNACKTASLDDHALVGVEYINACFSFSWSAENADRKQNEQQYR